MMVTVKIDVLALVKCLNNISLDLQVNDNRTARLKLNKLISVLENGGDEI